MLPVEDVRDWLFALLFKAEPSHFATKCSLRHGLIGLVLEAEIELGGWHEEFGLERPGRVALVVMGKDKLGDRIAFGQHLFGGKKNTLWRVDLCSDVDVPVPFD